MGTYISTSDLNTRFGSTNILNWSTIDDGDGATERAARQADAISYGEGYVVGLLRNSKYAVPFSFSDTGSLAILKNIMVIKAAEYLYTNRGLTDSDISDKILNLVALANKELAKISSGQLQLGANFKSAARYSAPRMV